MLMPTDLTPREIDLMETITILCVVMLEIWKWATELIWIGDCEVYTGMLLYLPVIVLI